MALFEIRETAGKGLGAFALQDLEAGQLLIAEEPILTLPGSTKKWLVGRKIEQLASELPKSLKEQYFSLHNSHVDYDGAEGIWYTNSLELGDSKDRNGIFLVISRFNHSCTPNALFHWSEKLEREVIYNIKAIPKGHEIEVAYVSVMAPFESRQEALKKNFNFDCHCQACSLPPTELELSESQRSECVAIAQRIDQQLDQAEPLLGLYSIRRSMDLATLEGVWESETAPLCYDAYRICVMWGDEQHAREWADLGFQLCSLIKGKDSSDSQMMKGMRDRPRNESAGGKSLWASLGKQDLIGPFDDLKPLASGSKGSTKRLQPNLVPIESLIEPAASNTDEPPIKLSAGQKKKAREKRKKAEAAQQAATAAATS